MIFVTQISLRASKKARGGNKIGAGAHSQHDTLYICMQAMLSPVFLSGLTLEAGQ